MTCQAIHERRGHGQLKSTAARDGSVFDRARAGKCTTLMGKFRITDPVSDQSEKYLGAPAMYSPATSPHLFSFELRGIANASRIISRPAEC